MTYNYTTAAKIRAYAGSPEATSISDTEIGYYEQWVESIIEDEAEEIFHLGTATAELHDGGIDRIWVKNAPIVSVGTLQINDVTKTDGTDYYVYGDEGCITFESIPPDDEQNISVTYVYGHSTVPGWVESVATRYAAEMVRERLDMTTGPEGLVVAREGVRARIIREVQAVCERNSRIYPAII